jgi:hypothetical protein
MPKGITVVEQEKQRLTFSRPMTDDMVPMGLGPQVTLKRSWCERDPVIYIEP